MLLGVQTNNIRWYIHNLFTNAESRLKLVYRIDNAELSRNSTSGLEFKQCPLLYLPRVPNLGRRRMAVAKLAYGREFCLPNMTLSDEDTGMMNRLGHTQFENLSLETTFQEIFES